MSRVRWPIPSHDPNPLGRSRPLSGVGLRLPGEDVLTNVNNYKRPPLPAPILTADFELGAKGKEIFSTDPGSDSPWNAVQGNPHPTYYGGNSAHGTLSMRKIAGVLSEEQALFWSFPSTPTIDHGRLYFYATANHSQITLNLAKYIQAGIGRAHISVNNTGKIRLVDTGGTHSQEGSVSIALNQWIRVEWRVVFSTTAGSIEAKLFNNADSYSPSEIITSPLNWDTGTGPDQGIAFDYDGDWGSDTLFDDIAANSSYWIGPVPDYHTILESTSESLNHSQQSTQTLLSAEAQEANNSGTGSFIVADVIAETVTNVNNPGYGEGVYGGGPYGAPDYISILEAIAESPLNINNIKGLTANFELGTNGNDILVTDPGYFQPWDIVNVNASVTYDSSTSVFGTKSAHFVTSGGAGTAHLAWEAAFGTRTEYYGRVCIRRLAYPSGVVQHVRHHRVGGTGTAWTLSLNPAGKIEVYDQAASLLATSLSPIPLGKWVRIEWHVNHTTGLLEVLYYIDPYSSYLTETIISATGQSIAADTTNVDYGIQILSDEVWYDALVDGAMSYPGPVDYDTILQADAESPTNSGSAQHGGLEAEAQGVFNSAESTQTLDETIFVPGAVKPIIIQVKAHSYPELVPVTKFHAVLTISSLEITETLTNEATSTQTLSEAEAQAIDNSSNASITILSAEAQDLNNSGQGSFTVADATSETVSISQTSTQSILEALAETATNDATAVVTLTAEATAETNTNTATNTPAILSAEAQDINNSGTGSFTTADATAETVLNSETSTQTILEAVADDLINFATAVISILSAEAQGINNSGSGSFTTADATAETVTNSATGVISIDEVILGASVIDTLTNVATADISILSAEAQAANNDGTGSFTVADATAETITSSATNVPSLLAFDFEELVNSGTATFTDGEVIAESMSSFATAVHSMLENGTVRLYPDEDISTGTWHDTPLFPKIDEVFPVGGYPTEAIISGDDPINDTAVLGLQTGNDPSMDIDHFINVQFYKIGAPTDDIDFIIKLKQGATVIATRTFVDVQETEASPRTERIGLTTGEVANITNYGDLRFEIIANKTN